MTTPSYSWEWFENHAPFKNILERYCDLRIYHRFQKYSYFGINNHHYEIFYDKALFVENFDKIKNEMLHTRVCRGNKDVYDFVNKKECNNRSISDLIVYGCGCMRHQSASFEWHDVSEYKGSE